MRLIKKPAFPTPLLNDRVSLIAAQLESRDPPSIQTLIDDGESEENIQLAMQDVLYHQVRIKLYRDDTLTLTDKEAAVEDIVNKASELQAKVEQFIIFYEEESEEEFSKKLEERIETFTPRLILKAKAFYEEMAPSREITPSPTLLHQFDPKKQDVAQPVSFTLRLNFGKK
jgi:hypothetical protein